MLESFFGTIALITSVIGLSPQVYKTYRVKSSENISMLMLANCFICSLSWIVYGLYSDSLFVWVSNAIALVITTVLIGQKIYYDAKSYKV